MNYNEVPSCSETDDLVAQKVKKNWEKGYASKNYTSGIFAAWEVIDSLLWIGCSVVVTVVRLDETVVEVHKIVPGKGGMPPTSKVIGVGVAPAAPLAICRAALNAVSSLEEK